MHIIISLWTLQFETQSEWKLGVKSLELHLEKLDTQLYNTSAEVVVLYCVQLCGS